MANTDRSSDGTHFIRLANEQPSASPAAALSDYLEQCDNRLIPPDTNLFLSAANRLTRDDIVTALPLCVNIIRIGTTLILPDGERFGRDDINASLSLRLVLALATLDEISRQHDESSLTCTEQG
jgi:hypothetical protein